jgi:HSP20 family protein
MRGAGMSWEDEFDLIRSYIRRRMKELEKELENAFSSMHVIHPSISIRPSSFDEPLHEAYETEDECVVVVDVPLLDETNVTVVAQDGLIKIEGRTRRAIKAEEIGYSVIRKEISRYYKEIAISRQCDVSNMSYSIRNGRLVIRMPKLK